MRFKVGDKVQFSDTYIAEVLSHPNVYIGEVVRFIRKNPKQVMTITSTRYGSYVLDMLSGTWNDNNLSRYTKSVKLAEDLFTL